MKTTIFTSAFSLLLGVIGFAGDLDGYWRCLEKNMNIEIMYTREGIKVKPSDRNSNEWDYYNKLDNNRYRDNRGNSYSFTGRGLEWTNADGRVAYLFSRYNPDETGSWRNSDRDNKDYNDRNYRDYDRNYRDNGYRDKDNWNKYYRIYEGEWHNHSTGTHIHVDLSKRSLRIKFHGEKWFEVYERNRGLFVDRKGNEFIFRGDGIEYRSSDGDLIMKFFNDDRCNHRDDFRSEYWR